MDSIDLIVNNLPAPTWEKLKMNRSHISDAVIEKAATVVVTGNNSIDVDDSKLDIFKSIKTGMGDEFVNFIWNSNVKPLFFSFDADKESKLRIDYDFGMNNEASIVLIEAGKNSDVEVVMDFKSSSESDVKTNASVLVVVIAEDNSNVEIVQLIRPSSNVRLMNDIGICQKDNASVKVIQPVINAGEAYIGVESSLEGYKSSLAIDSAYSLNGDDSLDYNYVARHRGAKSTSDMNANGSLKGSSYKIFRGTIDFIRGCAGAVGNEKEEVLLVDEKVVNKSVPLILCDEEDVEGNHGASLGKPDENQIFYFASRGIDEDKAYMLLAKAKIDAVCGLISNEDVKAEALEAVNQVYQEV